MYRAPATNPTAKDLILFQGGQTSLSPHRNPLEHQRLRPDGAGPDDQPEDGVVRRVRQHGVPAVDVSYLGRRRGVIRNNMMRWHAMTYFQTNTKNTPQAIVSGWGRTTPYHSFGPSSDQLLYASPIQYQRPCFTSKPCNATGGGRHYCNNDLRVCVDSERALGAESVLLQR